MKAIQFNGFKGENSSDGKWFTFYNKFSKCRFIYNSWWYFDERPCINTNVTTLLMFGCLISAPFITWWLLLSLIFIFIGWGNIYIHLPINTGKFDESDNPQYGFYFYCTDSPEYHLFEMIVLRWDLFYKSINMPWTLKFYRHSILLNDNTWEHEYYNKRKNFYKDEWKERQLVWEYSYIDSYDGEIIPTKIYVEEREWRRRWLFFTKLFNKINKVIDVKFSNEVGKEKGSWKGGCMGCGYKLLPNESPIDCIKRMEKERNF